MSFNGQNPQHKNWAQAELDLWLKQVLQLSTSYKLLLFS